MPSLVIGPGNDPESQMGPLVTAEHRDRVLSYVEGAERRGGAASWSTGRGEWPEGFFLGCTLLDGVRPGMRAYDDEIFGPVLGVVRVPTYEEALALVNANPYGNGTAPSSPATAAWPGVSSARSPPAWSGINVAIPVPVGFHSFGGWKSSLFGDSAMYGPEGIRFYTRPKVVTTRWPDPATSEIDLGFPRTR